MTNKEKCKLAEIEMLKLRARLDKTLPKGKLEGLFWKATGAGAIDYSKEHVQTSPTNTMESAIIALVDLETKVVEQITPYVDRMRSMDNGKVLYLKYIERTPQGEHLSWTQIGKLTNKTKDQVRYLHFVALVEYYNKFLCNR